LFVFTQFTPQGPGLDLREAIYVVRTDGGGIHRLTDSCTDCADSPRWSPDGSTLSFVRGDGRGNSSLIVLGASGNGKCLICTRCFGPSTWSPDGRRIASNTNTGPGIDIVYTSGHLVRRINTSPINSWDLDWSPDGSQLAFDDDVPGQRVFVIHANGTGLAFVARGADPRWSPDG
jgi:Tol biopolymer transport system component